MDMLAAVGSYINNSFRRELGTVYTKGTRFNRNTLVEYDDIRVIVYSSGEPYITRVFHVLNLEGYPEIDETHEVDYNIDVPVPESILEADNYHELVVREIYRRLRSKDKLDGKGIPKCSHDWIGTGYGVIKDKEWFTCFRCLLCGSHLSAKDIKDLPDCS